MNRTTKRFVSTVLLIRGCPQIGDRRHIHAATTELQFLVETPDETFPAYPCFNEWWYFRQVSRVDDHPASLHS